MTERLYYTDSYLADFEGSVVDRSPDGLRVVLDRTAFYPTSGGQPHDLGTLGGVAVREVADEEDHVVHFLEAPLPEELSRVEGRVDWMRRFDHMQQHTGQHLLSAIFGEEHGAKTVSVHFGAESATVDLAIASLDGAVMRAVEQRANAVVWEDRPVTISFEDAAEAAGLRKPTGRRGTIRVVSIEGIDRSACGGTHVRRTGEIGVILLRKVEKVKQGTRVEFLCGGRAQRRARADFEALQRMSQAFSVSPDELPSLLERQRDVARETDRERVRLQGELDHYRAREMYEGVAADARGRRVVVEPWSEGAERLRGFGQAVSAMTGAVFIGVLRNPPSLLVAASADTGVDAGALVKAVVTSLGGRGGGSPVLAQGSLPDASALEDAVARVTVALAEG